MEEQEGKEVIATPKEGELLVIMRALNLQRSTKDEQRENIFHIRCSIQGKVCSLIVGNGSYANGASTTLIKKNKDYRLLSTLIPTTFSGLIKVRDYKLTPGVKLHFQLGRTILMRFGVTLSIWIYVLCYLGDLECMIEE